MTVAPLEKFVGREKQINLVEERISIIRYGGSVFQAVINFHGVVGIGKTTLLRELEKRIREEGLPCTCVDFAAKDTWKALSPQSQVRLLEGIAHGFCDGVGDSALGEEIAHFDRLWDTGQQPEAEAQVETVVEEFLDYVKHLTTEQDAPAVLLLDTLERADRELLDWLEDTVISPLIRTDRVLVVVASRAPHRWKRFEVRRRADQQRLKPFDEEITGKQLPPRYSPLAPQVVRITAGHPFGNIHVIHSIRQIEEKVGRSFEQADFEEYKKRLVQELVDQLIEPVVMRDVPAEIKRAYRVVALARHFDVNVLRRLLTGFVEEPFAGKSAAYFLGVVGTMVKTTLVEWDSGRRGYVLDDTIRRMLALNVKLTSEERYKDINRELIRLYEEWIERVPENRSGFIIERLYHEACLQNVKGAEAETVAERLCDLLREYLQQYYPVEEKGKMPHGVTTLKEELSKDYELLRFLPQGREGCLTQIIEEAINHKYQQLAVASGHRGGQG